MEPIPWPASASGPASSGGAPLSDARQHRRRRHEQVKQSAAAAETETQTVTQHISQVVGSADSRDKYKLHYQRLVQPAAADERKHSSSSSSSTSSSATMASKGSSKCSSSRSSASSLSSGSRLKTTLESAAGRQQKQQQQQQQQMDAEQEREENPSKPPPYASEQQESKQGAPAVEPPLLRLEQQADVSSAARFKARDLSYADDGVRVRVEFYDSENTLKERLQMYFIKDHTVSLYLRIAKLVLNVLSCCLYINRVIMDRGPAYASCYGCSQPAGSSFNSTLSELLPSISSSAAGGGSSAGSGQQQQQQSLSKFDTHPYDGPINFRALFWVDRGPILWSMQTTIAVICLLEALLMQYLTYKNSIFSIISFHFTLELVTNTPFIISIFLKELRTLFVPGFLNCWLAKQCLEASLNGLSIVRQSSVFSHRLTILSATVFCLIFTSACGFQHTQRSGGRDNITIFESIYFVVVTFSTVGFGDFKPETWPSQLFIMVMICVALIVLPTQFEQLAYFWIERKKLGASYAHHSSRHEKHTFSVVLLSPCELDTTMKLVLQTPTWNNRVVYIQGSALKASDLIRARMQSAEACFILAARNYNDRSAADEHTILRSWAIRDFSPYVPQYVQIFRTENKIHVAFAEHVVCDDEFKYALLANNCLIPGTSTLVTLLLHTSQRESRRRKCAGFGFGLGLGDGGACRGGNSGAAKRLRKRRNRPRKDNQRQQQQRSVVGRLFRSLFCGSADNCNSSEADIRRKINDAVVRLNNHQSGAAEDPESGTGRGKADAAAAENSAREKEHDEKEEDEEEGGEGEEGEEEEEEDGKELGPEWKHLYGKCSANEIYHIRLSDSRFFGEYQGKSFTYASFHSHRKFGVALIGIQTDMRGTWPIMLNPGPSYVLKSGDILFYINITKEENSTLMPMLNHLHPVGAASATDKQQQLQPYQSLVGGGGGEPQPPPALEPLPASASQSQATQPASSGPPRASLDGNVQLPVAAADATAAASAAAGATCIRIESSSPTPMLQDQAEASAPTARSRLLPVQKHSVADGAGMVARSLCSMAGIETGVASTDRDDDVDDDELQQTELHHLTADLLAKRTSSASTSAAMEAAGQLAPGGHGGAQLSAKQRQVGSSTLELAALASGLRKGSNLSVCSSNRSKGDVSPTRLKQVVSGLAVKMKRVKLGKSLTHLTIPRMDYGGGSNSACSSTESFVNARGRRPSIAPVPAMMGESEEHDSDHDREQESYFSMLWQSSSESSPIVKKFVFCTTYVGVSPTLCYLLQKKKPACCLQLVEACAHCAYRNARQYNWPNRCIILASDFASKGIYNFLVPLRAHFHNPAELRPIVLLLERKPSPQFIDAISWFPMVYWMPGSIDSLDDLINAGINLAHSVVVTNKESTNSAEEDYLADCNTIVAVQTMFKMFPSVGIITELSQSSNMRFMQFRAHDVLFSGLSMANYPPPPPSNQLTDSANNNNQEEDSGQPATFTGNAIRDRIQLRKLHSQYYTRTQMGKEVNSHAYKYRLPFAAGNVFSASMLDTLLYQAFVKDYMITMVRLLLGIDQAPGSGFLSSMKITKEDLWIRTYGRLYQRLCSTTCEIPLGIYRTEPLESCSPSSRSAAAHQQQKKGPLVSSLSAFASQQASYEHATEELERIEITNMVKNRLRDLGMLVSDYDDSSSNSRNSTFSYVIINPNCDIHLREGDIIYLIRPSPIHSRKLFMHRANSVRHSEAPKTTTTTTTTSAAMEQKQAEPSAAASGDKKRPSKGDAGAGGRSSKRPSQTGAEQAMKSCLSDGDFAGILIKLNDEQNLTHTISAAAAAARQSGGDHSTTAAMADPECSAGHRHATNRTLSPGGHQYATANDSDRPDSECSLRKNRRRSSCSDAEDSKRFDSFSCD